MKNLLSRSKYAVLLLFLLALSCEKEDCPIPEPPEDNKLVIEVDINKMYWGESGASGLVNGENKEYGMAEYLKSLNDLYGLQFVQSVWYENTVWAAREVIVLINIDLTAVGDTIELFRQEIVNTVTEPVVLLSHVYLDGDAVGEYYEIDDGAGTGSWLLINDYDIARKTVVGEFHLSLVITSGPKYDPNAPDYITIRNFRFRAKLRE